MDARRYGDRMRPLDVDALPLLEEHRDDSLVLRYIELYDRTARAEMISDPRTWSFCCSAGSLRKYVRTSARMVSGDCLRSFTCLRLVYYQSPLSVASYTPLMYSTAPTSPSSSWRRSCAPVSHGDGPGRFWPASQA